MPYRRQRLIVTPERRHRLLAGGALLAGCAGFVNAVLLSFFHVPVSHTSGALAHLGVAIGGGTFADAVGSITIVGAFFLGSMTSGAIVGRDGAPPGRRYGLVLVFESVALAVSGSCLYARLAAGVPLAAFACGLQNAMSSSYYGLALRTTHVTGMVTDLGVMAGQWIRHRRLPRWQAMLLATLTGAFLVGGIAGAASIVWLDYRVLYVPAAGTLAAGLAYALRAERRARTPIPERAPYAPRHRPSGNHPTIGTRDQS